MSNWVKRPPLIVIGVVLKTQIALINLKYILMLRVSVSKLVNDKPKTMRK